MYNKWGLKNVTGARQLDDMLNSLNESDLVKVLTYSTVWKVGLPMSCVQVGIKWVEPYSYSKSIQPVATTYKYLRDNAVFLYSYPI